jgi:hypothetical protein
MIPSSLKKARELFEVNFEHKYPMNWIEERSEYTNDEVQKDWLIFLLGFEAAWAEVKPSQYTDSTGNVNWDLDISGWESIKEAAQQSKWIPVEYYMNDWIADVMFFLREGNNETITSN